MSWASAYEPMQPIQQMQPMQPMQQMQMGSQMDYSQNSNVYTTPPSNQQLPSTMPNMMAARPPVQTNPQANNVQVPKKVDKKDPKWEDISEYQDVSDWAYIVVAVLVVEALVICLIRFFPAFFGKNVNIWYNRFKLSAVLADMLIILVGFGISRYVYSEFIYPTYDWKPLYFGITTVVVQLVHDVLFYLGVIRQIPAGQNAMMDVFKDYSAEKGGMILVADSLMVIGSTILAMLLKASQPHIVVSVALVSAYIIPYVLETKNNFSNIA
jgi:hypothetical protein